MPIYTFFIVFLLSQVALGQTNWIVETLIPDVISLQTPTDTISFELDADSYPPSTFPHRYAATVPLDGVLPIKVFSNAEGLWNLLLEVPDLLDENGQPIISAQQILYSVNDGLWLRANGNPQIVYTGSGQTNGWLDLFIAFELELTGSEPAGDYTVDVLVTAFHDN